MGQVQVAKDNLYIGTPELARLQALLDQNRSGVDASIIAAYGLVMNRVSPNVWSTDWYVSQQGGLTVNIQAGRAVVLDSTGAVRAIVNPSLISNVAIPASAGTYKVAILYGTNNYETGTAHVTNGSATVSGNGTAFTKVFKANRTLIVAGASYAVQSVESDTSLTLAAPFGGSSNTVAQFSVGGWFSTPPGAVADRQIYLYDTYSIVITTGALASGALLLATVTVSGGAITNVADGRTTNVFALRDSGAMLQGTTWPSFRVGIGSMGAGNAGVLVMTEGDVPPAPRNLRVVDVVPQTELPYLQSDMTALMAFTSKKGLLTHRADVRIAWNWTDIQGTGGAGQFTVSNSSGDKVFTSNELVGFNLVLPSNGGTYRVTANAATSGGSCVLTVTNTDGSAADLTGLSASSGTPAAIDSGVSSYEIRAIPVDTSYANQPSKTLEQIVAGDDYSGGYVTPTCIMGLNVGFRYKISVRAVRGSLKSAYVDLAAGSYAKTTPPYASASYSYMGDAHPFLVKLPALAVPDAGAVTAKSTPMGFSITIGAGAWTPATDFEIVYVANDTPDFTDAAQTKLITSDRYVEISAAGGNYGVAVRPLMAGQAVDTAVSFDVTSGVAGAPPAEATITQNVSLQTYKGTLSARIGGKVRFMYSLSNLVSPANQTYGGGTGEWDSGFGTPIINQLMVDSSNSESQIEGIQGADTVIMADTDLIAGTVTVNTTKNGRRVYYAPKLGLDYQIYKVAFQCDTLNPAGGNAVIRWYQESKENLADAIIVNARGMFPKSTDVRITALQGDRNLVVDFFDPGTFGGLNNACVTGTITIYMRPIVG
jgi:hypothetical protein